MPGLNRFAEGVVRRLLRLPIRILTRRRGRLPDDPPRRILLLRHDRIGDWVITTPLVSLLRKAWPAAEIDVIASPRNAPLIQIDPRIGRVHVYADSFLSRVRLVRACRRLDYDYALQLILGRTTLTTILLRLAAPRAILAGYRNPRNAFMFDATGVTDDPHFAERTTSVGRVLPGLASVKADDQYSLALPPDALTWGTEQVGIAGLRPLDFVLVNASAGSSDRTMTSEFCGGLIVAIRARGLQVALTCDPTDRKRILAVGTRHDVPVLTPPDIVHAAALYSNGLVVITPDTSIVHIASASGRPVVALYPAHGDPAGWGPRWTTSRVVVAESSDGEISDIPPEVVAKATLELIGRGD